MYAIFMVEIPNVRTDGRKPQPTCGFGHQTTLDPKVYNNKWIFEIEKSFEFIMLNINLFFLDIYNSFPFYSVTRTHVKRSTIQSSIYVYLKDCQI